MKKDEILEKARKESIFSGDEMENHAKSQASGFSVVFAAILCLIVYFLFRARPDIPKVARSAVFLILTGMVSSDYVFRAFLIKSKESTISAILRGVMFLCVVLLFVIDYLELA